MCHHSIYSIGVNDLYNQHDFNKVGMYIILLLTLQHTCREARKPFACRHVMRAGYTVQ